MGEGDLHPRFQRGMWKHEKDILVRSFPRFSRRIDDVETTKTSERKNPLWTSVGAIGVAGEWRVMDGWHDDIHSRVH